MSFLPLRKDILKRICPIELKFSGFVVLSKFCRMNIIIFSSLLEIQMYISASNVLEPWTETGSERFPCQDSGHSQIFNLIFSSSKNILKQ